MVELLKLKICDEKVQSYAECLLYTTPREADLMSDNVSQIPIPNLLYTMLI